MALDRPSPRKRDPKDAAPAAKRPPNRTPDRVAAVVSPMVVYGMFAYSAFVVISPLIRKLLPLVFCDVR